MAKSLLKIKARKMRQDGKSIIEIADALDMWKSTVSMWCRDISLTPEQISSLLTRRENRLKAGQIKGAMINKQKRLDKIENYRKEGKRELSSMTAREFFIAGIALYIAEGSKKNRHVEFINSDPILIKFILKWLRFVFKPKDEEICFTIFINEMHRSREDKIREYWRTYLNTPSIRFRNTVFLKSARKKQYENHENYYGTFRVSLLKENLHYYKILGLIDAFFSAQIESV